MIDNLLWEKYRPKTLDDIILLPRIRKEIVDGKINSNVIMYGHFGTGKTTLSRILIKGKPVLYFNTSLDTGIYTLRDDITNHVNTISDIFDSGDSFKYVFLDEFEEASSKYQNALKAFIEEYSTNVRFIFVTNHIHKVEPGIVSRCTQLDFNPRDENESRWWKTECKDRLIHIAQQESINIEEIDIKKIVSHNFPDMRKMVEVLSSVRRTGIIDYSITTYDNELRCKLYNTLKDGTILDLQKFVLDNYGPERVSELFNLCGRPLLEELMRQRKDLLPTDVFGDIYNIVSEHSMWLNTIKGGDPVVTATSCLTSIQKRIRNGK